MTARIAVVGAGAVGGHLAAKLAHAGHRVSVLARGAHLAAMQAGGIRFAGKQNFTAPVIAAERGAALGPQDVVFVTAKAQHLPALAAEVPALLGPETPVVFAVNGIPWWWFKGLGAGPSAGAFRPIERLDPGRAVERTIGLDRTIGCVVYSSNTLEAPGAVRNVTTNRNRFLIGEPSREKTARVQRIAALFEGIDLDVPVADNIHREVWQKLLTNIGNSATACLTGGTVGETLSDPAVVQVARRINEEAVEIAALHGIQLPPGYSPDHVKATLASPVVGHKPSMLQDLEAGKPLELDAQFLVPQDFAREGGLKTPVLDTVTALLSLRAELALRH